MEGGFGFRGPGRTTHAFAPSELPIPIHQTSQLQQASWCPEEKALNAMRMVSTVDQTPQPRNSAFAWAFSPDLRRCGVVV